MERVLLVTRGSWREELGWYLGQALPNLQLLNAEDGLRAIQLFTEAYREGTPYQLIVLDEALPRVSAERVVEALRILEQEESGPATPCLFLQSNGATQFLSLELAPGQILGLGEASQRSREVASAIYQHFCPGG